MNYNWQIHKDSISLFKVLQNMTLHCSANIITNLSIDKLRL